jgi:hypothetical protein
VGRVSAVGSAAMVIVAILGSCGTATVSKAVQSQQQAYLAQVHDQDPTISQVRTDVQLIRLGSAACSGFAAGVSFEALADHMALEDGNFPTEDLGTVITAAAEHLCPKYSSLVR